MLKDVFVATTFAIVVAGPFALLPYVSYSDCVAYSKVTGRETKMQSGTCYVKHDGIWFTREEFKALITANGVLTND